MWPQKRRHAWMTVHVTFTAGRHCQQCVPLQCYRKFCSECHYATARVPAERVDTELPCEKTCNKLDIAVLTIQKVVYSLCLHFVTAMNVCNEKHTLFMCSNSLSGWWWSGVVVSALASVNKVNLRRTRLVLKWATISGSIPGARHLFRYVTNQPPKANSAFHPSGVGKWAPASAGKAKAGMVHSVSGWTWGVQVKLWDPLRTRAIPERFRGAITTRRYTNHVYLYLY